MDFLQSQNARMPDTANALNAKRTIDIIIGTSSEHAGCYLAMRYGLAMAVAGHVSIIKLAKVTKLTKQRCQEILSDMQAIIGRAGVMEA